MTEPTEPTEFLDTKAPQDEARPEPGMNRRRMVIWGVLLTNLLTLLGISGLFPVSSVGENPSAREVLGKVQRVSFPGGTGSGTQVELPGKVLLLYRAVELDAGTEVERRRGPFSDQLCVVQTERCFDVASR